MKRFIIEQSSADIISHSGLSLIGQAIKQYTHLTSVSLPRDRFWDIQVSKIDSPTRQPLLPRPSCVRAASPHL
ncbi:hypothetical protein, partial [Thiolapillus sp.]|uniref:hypothetical protein n=1 Tax=Thiolapillus sp. TaxID=2017437 RepID=UPI0025FC511E